MDEDFEKRFYCDGCGHNFCMEVDEDMPEPKFCIFCGSTVYVRDEDEDEADEDEFY
jgi:rRNA maturation endonuclease Nob1